MCTDLTQSKSLINTSPSLVCDTYGDIPTASHAIIGLPEAPYSLGAVGKWAPSGPGTGRGKQDSSNNFFLQTPPSSKCDKGREIEIRKKNPIF